MIPTGLINEYLFAREKKNQVRRAKWQQIIIQMLKRIF